jgi:DNA-binding FadR family transcriptional regulator
MLEMVLRRSVTLGASGDHRPRSIAEHRRVLETIAERDPDAARQAMELLIGHSAGDLKQMHAIASLGGGTSPR